MRPRPIPTPERIGITRQLVIATFTIPRVIPCGSVITNLDQELLGPLQHGLHDVPISHIVMVFMESGQNNLFSLKAGSRLHTQIRESYTTGLDADAEADLDHKLSLLTPVAERPTGERSGFNHTRFAAAPPDMGGISIVR